MPLPDLILRFAGQFHQGDLPEVASAEAVDRVDRDLGITTPTSYRTLLCAGGGLFTPDTLTAIVQRDLDFPDVQNIWLPSDVVPDTRASWAAGMPEHVVGFANDAAGSYFCFPRERLPIPRGDAPVWFFDHDLCEAYELSPSLTAWLQWYLDNLGAA